MISNATILQQYNNFYDVKNTEKSLCAFLRLKVRFYENKFYSRKK